MCVQVQLDAGEMMHWRRSWYASAHSTPAAPCSHVLFAASHSTKMQFDREMAAQTDAAAAEGAVLRYVGLVDAEGGTASVTLKR